MTLVFTPPAETRSKADRAFGPIMAQEDIDAQVLREKIRAFAAELWLGSRWVLLSIAFLALIRVLGG